MASLIFSLIFIDGVNLKRRYYFIICLLCFLGLFRGQSVGVDVAKYCVNIKHTSFDPTTWNYYTVFEDGYNYIIAAYNCIIGGPPLIFIGLCSVFFVLSWDTYAKNKVSNYGIALFVLFFLGYYNQSYNIIRQYFALSIMLFILSKYDLEKINKKGNLILITTVLFVGTYFHNSIYLLLLIPLYSILRKANLIQKKFFYIMIAGTTLIFCSGVVRDFLGAYSSAFFLINAKTDSYFHTSLEDIIDANEYSVIRLLIDNAFCLYMIYKSPKLDIYVFLYMCGQIVINLLAPLDVLFARLSGVLIIPAIPAVINIWNKKTKYVIIFYLFIMFGNLIAKNYGDTIPYLFFFE